MEDVRQADLPAYLPVHCGCHIRRVDSEVDQRLLESFVDSLFTAKAYETGFPLVQADLDGGGVLHAPEGTKLQDYLKWCRLLPEREVRRCYSNSTDVGEADEGHCILQPPSWLSLPPNSEQLLAITEGIATLAN